MSRNGKSESPSGSLRSVFGSPNGGRYLADRDCDCCSSHESRRNRTGERKNRTRSTLLVDSVGIVVDEVVCVVGINRAHRVVIAGWEEELSRVGYRAASGAVG